MSDYPGAIWIPNQNFYPDSGTKDHIVIHGTAGGSSAEGIAAYFHSSTGGSNPVSSNYIVGQDGTIVQCVLEKDGAWANGTLDMNDRAISIEHVKSHTDNSDELTLAQEQASFNLIKDIRTRHSIPIENIIPHSAVISTACPGPYPFDKLRAFLGGSMVPQGWSDDGKTLTAPNGVKVVLGFRDFVLGNNWGSDDWPLRPEYAVNPVEQSNPSEGEGEAQEFRMSRLIYIKATNKVVKSWIGQELIWYMGQHNKPIPATAQADIQTAIDALSKVKVDLS